MASAGNSLVSEVVCYGMSVTDASLSHSASIGKTGVSGLAAILHCFVFRVTGPRCSCPVLTVQGAHRTHQRQRLDSGNNLNSHEVNLPSCRPDSPNRMRGLRSWSGAAGRL